METRDARTGYQVEEQKPDGTWAPVGHPFETMTLAEIIRVSSARLIGKITRVTPVAVGNQGERIAERPSWVPKKVSDEERSANIQIIKTLAEGLDPVRADYASTLESLVIRSRFLFDEAARWNGRGYKDGENRACQSCNGVYTKEGK